MVVLATFAALRVGRQVGERLLLQGTLHETTRSDAVRKNRDSVLRRRARHLLLEHVAGADGKVRQRHQGLAHTVGGRVDLDTEAREAAVKVGGQVLVDVGDERLVGSQGPVFELVLLSRVGLVLVVPAILFVGEACEEFNTGIKIMPLYKNINSLKK